MTIQVTVSHGDIGHPAPFFITRQRPDGTFDGLPVMVAAGGAITLYIHAGVQLLVTERPPEG